jgi:hypothetical protein
MSIVKRMQGIHATMLLQKAQLPLPHTVEYSKLVKHLNRANLRLLQVQRLAPRNVENKTCYRTTAKFSRFGKS